MAVSCFGSETRNIERSREKQKETGELSPNCASFYIHLIAPGPTHLPSEAVKSKKVKFSSTILLSSDSIVLFVAAAQEFCVYCISTCCAALFVVLCVVNET